MGDAGLYAVGKIVTSGLGWIVRPQPSADTGIDAEVEVVRDQRATGELLKLQVKSGASYFRGISTDAFDYYGEIKHLAYWMRHALPVLLVFYDPLRDVAYWTEVTETAVERTAKGWKTTVSKSCVFDEHARGALEGIAQTHDVQVARIVDALLSEPNRADAAYQAVRELEDTRIAVEVGDYIRIIQELQPAKATVRSLVSQGVLSRTRDVRYVAEFGEYKILSQLGRGGMGIVFKAFEEPLGRLVALKISHPQPANETRHQHRIRQEARVAARIAHPNVVTIHKFGSSQGVQYLVMEYIDGHTLADIIGETAMTANTVVRTFRQLLWALDAIHAAGYIHRDIKPSNILVEEESWTLKVADFGLAIPLGGAEDGTPGSGSAGTPQYMSPEQTSSKLPLDERTDLYSAGVVLHEMLTGRRPLDGDATAHVPKVLDESTDALSIEKDVDPNLAAIARNLLSSARDDRYSSARQVLEVLDARTSA